MSYASVTVIKKIGGERDSIVGGALTQENGKFNITGLPMGPMTVKIRFVGYKDLTKSVVITLPNDTEQDLGNFRDRLFALCRRKL